MVLHTYGELMDAAYDRVTDPHLQDRLSAMGDAYFALVDLAYGDRLYAVQGARVRLDAITDAMRAFAGDVCTNLGKPEHAHRNLTDDGRVPSSTSPAGWLTGGQ